MQLEITPFKALGFFAAIVLPFHVAHAVPPDAAPDKPSVQKRSFPERPTLENVSANDESSQAGEPQLHERKLKQKPAISSKPTLKKQTPPSIPASAPEITHPDDGGEVHERFSVFGRGVPNHTVRVKTRLWFTVSSGMESTNNIDTKQTTVDSNGRWEIHGFELPDHVDWDDSDTRATIYATQFFPGDKEASAPVVTVTRNIRTYDIPQGASSSTND